MTALMPGDRVSNGRRLMPFRFLLVVYSLAAMSAGWEIAHRAQPVDLVLDPRANYADTLQELYPGRGETKYQQARQALVCLQYQSAEQPAPTTCRKYESQDLRRQIRRTFEQALDTKIKTQEELYYSYLQILIGSQAPKSKIDAAYHAWRRNFPLSTLPDPRIQSSDKPGATSALSAPRTGVAVVVRLQKSLNSHEFSYPSFKP